MDMKQYEESLSAALTALTAACNQIIAYDMSGDEERPFPHGPGFAIGRLDAAIEIITSELPQYLLEEAVANTLKELSDRADEG